MRRLKDSVRELMRTGPGRVGMALLLLQIAASLYVIIDYPRDFGREVWNNPANWADNPKAVAPGWVPFFSRDGRVKHTIREVTSPDQVNRSEGKETRVYRVGLPYKYEDFPTFLSFSLSEVSYHSSPPQVTVSLARPDGRRVLLLRHSVPGPRQGEPYPVTRYGETPWRVSLSASQVVFSNVASFYRSEFGVEERRLRGAVPDALFGLPSGEGFQVLTGDYQAIVEVRTFDPADEVDSVRFVVGGAAFGLMGTDSVGRDLARGLLFGLPIALFIGLMTSVLTTALGTTLGIVSGYLGGWVDTLIQRLADIVSNVPLLPVLIFLVFILGSKLYLIILILAAFSWPGMTILIRSMVLQLRSSQFVESAVVLGSSRWRIMFRHIFPWTAPFIFSQMIFFTPSAILAEAGLSFLGLGDPSIPTWGQILEQGFRTGAVYLGHWWWVLPPGLLIVLTAVTFALLALGMESMVNPRLRRTR